LAPAANFFHLHSAQGEPMQQANAAGTSLRATQLIRYPVQQVCNQGPLRDANAYYGYAMAIIQPIHSDTRAG
jgi:hypothetical protein